LYDFYLVYFDSKKKIIYFYQICRVYYKKKMLTYHSKLGKPERVEAVEFGIIGDEEIKNISVAEITETTIYFRGMPHVNGINDHRMGTVDRRLNCGTCGKDVRLCPGHPGHIKLHFPCYHIGYVETILKILRSVCFFCSKLCMAASDMDTSLVGKARLPFVYNIARNKKKCIHCGTHRPTYSRSGLGIKIEWDSDSFISDEEKRYCCQTFTPLIARSILQNISDEDYVMMGFNPARSHPKHCIMFYLSICPPVARPAIMASEGSRARGQDDLTHKLQDINKRNLDVKEILAAENWDMYSGISPSSEALEKINKLQFEVYTYMNNSIRGQKQSTQRSGAPTKSVTDRLKGKEGRIRGNLMGKRVDFSARSVITPDAVMDVDQVGVPSSIALILTIPEKVTPSNIYKLHQRVSNGSRRLDGAETVITSNGTVIQLEFCQNRSQIRLQYGWVVERYLQDEDIVIFNRQPSLHKMGMMGHRVKIMDGRTFRLNLCCANPYNADFDGDEMNMHVPQSSCSTNEVKGIMMVHQQIISPQANKPVMGIVQDSLLGSYLLTGPGIFLEAKQVMDIVNCVVYPLKKLIPLPEPQILRPTKLWTGIQVFSFLFPPTLTMVKGKMGSSGCFYIRNGELLLGRINKSLLGTSAGGIIDVMYRDFGSSITVNFMADVQRLVNRWLLTRAFCVGICDCVLNKEGQEKVNNKLNTTIESVDELVKEASGEVDAEQLESTIIQMLSRLLMQTGSIVQENMLNTNAIRTMVNAGSKGNPINLSQICGCVGQQSVEGRRVHSERFNRTLTYFSHKDVSVNGHGLVQNSYALGLHPYEYFFHAMGGREGLVDTAVKTATTGYIQRRQIKAMEDNRCHYDGTVRNAESLIVQFMYGGDGYDACKLEKHEFPAILMSDSKLKEWFVEHDDNIQQLEEMKIVTDLVKQMRKDRFDPVSKTIPTWVIMPVNMQRILKFHSYTKEENIMSIDDIIQVHSDLFNNLEDEKRKSTVTNAVLRFYLSSANIRRMRITKRELINIKDTIILKMSGARAAAGEMVGAIAAQSIGEPCTQMSCPYGCMVLSKQDGKIQNKPIGEIIDSYLPKITSNDQHDILEVRNLQCVGVTPTESSSWANITHVSRHPANGDMITIRTKHGKNVCATASHSFLTRSKNRIIPTIGSDLVIGDCIPIVKNLPITLNENIQSPLKLTKVFGRFIGAIVSEGYINKNSISFSNTQKYWAEEIGRDFQKETNLNVGFHYRKMHELSLGNGYIMHITVNNRNISAWMTEHFGRTSHNKTLPAWILEAPEDFVVGILQTYFDGDGNVQVEKRHHRLCCHSVSEELITMLSLCLARFGIPTYIGQEDYKTPAGNPGIITRLNIPICFAAKFQEHIGFSIDYKVELLKYVVIEQEKESMRGFQAYIPGINEVLEEIREYIPFGGDKNSFETLLRKEFRRIQRKPGITPKMLMRIREHAKSFKAPDYLIEELDYAINADVWWDPIVSIDIEKDSMEMVYDFTVDQNLQSFMLSNGVFVHNTLNSVDWNTHMAVHWTGNTPPPAPADAEVGKFIDALIEARPNDIQVQPDGVTIYLPLPKGSATALSSDEDGNMMWTELEAVTRHPPINKDGSDTLMKVTTESGHEVTVTKGKSLLVERNGKLVEVNGDEVSIGDRVPIVQDLPNTNITHLNLHSVFAEYEVVFTNTMIEAIEAAKADRHWFLKGAFKNRSCYSRSDILMDAMKKRPQLKTPDMVAWPKGQSALLPVEIPLDREFGFFIGAFLSEGALTDHQVHIANVDPSFREACKVWPERYGIKSHITSEKHQKKNNGTSISVMFHSTFLVNLLKRTCGKGSYNKRVPSFAMVAPTDFIQGLLDGYISGDGSISKKQTYISAHSRSKALRDGIVLLLSKFGIDSKLSEALQLNHVEWITEENGRRTQKKYGELKPVYSFSLVQKNVIIFSRNITLTLEYKQRRQDEILESAHKCMKTNIAYMNDVKLDKIVKIEDISSSHEFVYDLTVAKTRNMTTISGFVLVDTFHYAGVSNKNVSLGIPRLKEILDNSKHIRTPLNTLHFKKPFCYNKKLVQHMANTLPLTKLNDIVSSVDFVTELDAADEILDNINSLYDPIPEGTGSLIARIVLNKSIMNKRSITPPLLRRILEGSLGNRAHFVSSETNSIEWVLIIRFSNIEQMLENCPYEGAERILIQRTLKAIMESTTIGGHPKIPNSSMREMDCWDEETRTNTTEYVVDTVNTSLASFASIPCVDWYRCSTNDINEVVDILGIEATVELLFRQINEVISFDGTYVDPRHIMMIVDTMTYRGYVMPLSRHGLNRTDTGPLVRCSFEETVEILYEAALFNEVDCGKGVTQNIMTGQVPKIGTGCFDVQLPVKNVNVDSKKNKIAKSVIKTRPVDEVIEQAKIEYLDPNMWNWKSPPEAAHIETPFSTAKENLNDDNSIFSSNKCHLPFEDDGMADNPIEYSEAAIAPSPGTIPFRPTSPMSDE
jgi:DNA-directed RNA polymerase beta' subunit